MGKLNRLIEFLTYIYGERRCKMKKVYKGVNITIETNDNDSSGKEISAKDLAGILSSTSYQTIREAIKIVCEKDRNSIVRFAQCVHGVLYVSYYKMTKNGCY